MNDLDDYRKDILNHIFITGGYTNAYNLMKYLGASQKTCWHYLEIFTDGTSKERYLKKVNDETRGSRDKLLYQVTAKTCALFNQKDSYYRKKHKREYIARSLLKNRYFSVNKEMKSKVIFLHDDKLEYLKNVGFNNDILPYKHVGKNKIFTIEDTLHIDKGIEIIYFDKENVTVKRQVVSLYSTYVPVIKSNLIPIKIKVVTINNFREIEYIKEMSNYNAQVYKTENIDNNLVELYASFNARIAKSRGEDINIINQNLKDGTIKSALLERMKKTQIDIDEDDVKIIRNISKRGMKYIVDDMKTRIINESEKSVREYLLNIIRLNYHNYIIFKNMESVTNIDVISDSLF